MASASAPSRPLWIEDKDEEEDEGRALVLTEGDKVERKQAFCRHWLLHGGSGGN